MYVDAKIGNKKLAIISLFTPYFEDVLQRLHCIKQFLWLRYFHNSVTILANISRPLTLRFVLIQWTEVYITFQLSVEISLHLFEVDSNIETKSINQGLNLSSIYWNTYKKFSRYSFFEDPSFWNFLQRKF